MALPFHYLYLCSLFLSIAAANDWNKPCFSGVCEYDLPSTNGRSGTLKIWGPSSSIGDITPAAGWAILDCSPESLQQTVRIACIDEGSPDCAHLFSNTTNLNYAVGKVVRLPETCGKSAFGFVTNASLHEDQSIPVSMVSSLTRRDGTLPTVHGLHISTNTADWVQVGQNVHFSIQAANIHIPQHDTNIQGRGIVDDFINDIVDDIVDGNNYNKSGSVSLKPVEVNQNFTVFDQTISCPNFTGGVSIHVNTKSYAIMTLDLAATGTFVPPKVDSISLTSNFSANIDTIVDVKSNITGMLNTGEIKVYEAPFPGLHIAGIMSIGPSFVINAMAAATLNTKVGMKIDIKYNVIQPSFTFPNPHKSGEASVELGDTPLTVDFTPSVDATGTQAVSVHLIPTLKFDIKAFGKGVNVFVNVDSSVSASLAVTPNNQLSPPIDGCFEADTRLSVNAVADADFFGLFNAATQLQLYDRSSQLIRTCYGTSARKRSWPSRRNLDWHRKRSFDLQCLSLSSLSPVSIVNQIIPTSNITSI